MNFLLRSFAVLCASLALAPSAAAQQAWPTRDVRIIAPFPAGSPADQIVRLVVDPLKQVWGQTIVVENVPGAAGSVGVTKVAKSPADGYTLVMSGDAAIVVNISLYKSLAYDPVKDLAPIVQVGRTPNILVVNNDVPAKSLKEFVAWAKANPGTVKFNSTGYCTSQHMGIEQLKKAADLQIIHVPSRDQTAPEILGGHVHASFMNITIGWPLVQAGKLRALGLSGAERASIAPDIPTIAEQGYPGFNAVAWFGLLAPAGTPAPIIDKIHVDLAKVLGDKDIREKLTQRGFQLVDSNPASFSALIKSEIPRIAELIKASGIKLD
ncbi:MAG: Bug family tripartite tricarboxylate transporter substrate binding protein [Hyphomicrobiaceae bacterium]